MRGLLNANAEYGMGDGRGRLAGTSNVHFAQKYDITPIGTIAHELIMGEAALTGYEGSNGRTMDLWDKTYPSGGLSIALTDTFSTKPFFEDFVSKPERAKRWRGLRQDSGDPFKFIDIAKDAFLRVGANPKESKSGSQQSVGTEVDVDGVLCFDRGYCILGRARCGKVYRFEASLRPR